MSRKEVSILSRVAGLGPTPHLPLSPVLVPRAPEQEWGWGGAQGGVGGAEGAAVNLGTAPELVSAWPPQGGDIYIREQRTVEEGRDPGECQQVGSAPCIVHDPCPSPALA